MRIGFPLAASLGSTTSSGSYLLGDRRTATEREGAILQTSALPVGYGARSRIGQVLDGRKRREDRRLILYPAASAEEGKQHRLLGFCARAGDLHDRPPQVGDHLDKFRELFEIHGLRQEGVCCAYSDTLLLALGHCEHHNRKLPQVRILSDAKEHVSPVQLRQIEIE